MATNECIPIYEPASRITGQTTAAVVGKRFVKVTNNPADTNGLFGAGLVQVGPGTAGCVPVGVACYDQATVGGVVPLICQPGMIIPVKGSGAISAGDLISVGTDGKAVVATPASQSGTTPFAVTAGSVVVGQAVDDAADGADVPVRIFF